MFGPDTVTWTYRTQFVTTVRTISRVNLTFTEDTDVAGNKSHQAGTCTVVKKPAVRKF